MRKRRSIGAVTVQTSHVPGGGKVEVEAMMPPLN